MLNVAKARFLSNIVREFIKVAELNFTHCAARIANDMMVVRMMFNEFKAGRTRRRVVCEKSNQRRRTY
jgi:hypothetical protein